MKDARSGRSARLVAQFSTKPGPVSVELPDLFAQVCAMFTMAVDVVWMAFELVVFPFEGRGVAQQPMMFRQERLSHASPRLSARCGNPFLTL
jgi:hypothetical protein